MNTLRNKGVVIGLIILIIVAGIYWYRQATKPAAPVDNLVYVQTKTIQEADQESSNTYAGVVKGRYESQRSFQVSGKIIAKYVQLGTKVHKGQVLMRLDDRDIKENVDITQAQIAAAQSQLDLAASTLQRFKNLYNAHAISSMELDQYQNAYNSAKANYERAVAQNKQGNNALAYTSLIADCDGVVTQLNGDIGQVVAPGQVLVTIVSDHDLEVELQVPENRIDRLHVGELVNIKFWALKNLHTTGKVREIAPMADPISRTYKVRVTIANYSQQIKLGMTASVEIAGSTQEHVVSLPLNAIYQTGDKPMVWLVDSTKHVHLHPVDIVDTTSNQAVVKGLDNGDIVVIAGVHKLSDNQEVKLMDGDSL